MVRFLPRLHLLSCTALWSGLALLAPAASADLTAPADLSRYVSDYYPPAPSPEDPVPAPAAAQQATQQPQEATPAKTDTVSAVPTKPVTVADAPANPAPQAQPATQPQQPAPAKSAAVADVPKANTPSQEAAQQQATPAKTNAIAEVPAENDDLHEPLKVEIPNLHAKVKKKHTKMVANASSGSAVVTPAKTAYDYTVLPTPQTIAYSQQSSPVNLPWLNAHAKPTVPAAANTQVVATRHVSARRAVSTASAEYPSQKYTQHAALFSAFFPRASSSVPDAPEPETSVAKAAPASEPEKPSIIETAATGFMDVVSAPVTLVKDGIDQITGPDTQVAQLPSPDQLAMLAPAAGGDVSGAAAAPSAAAPALTTPPVPPSAPAPKDNASSPPTTGNNTPVIQLNATSESGFTPDSTASDSATTATKSTDAQSPAPATAATSAMPAKPESSPGQSLPPATSTVAIAAAPAKTAPDSPQAPSQTQQPAIEIPAMATTPEKSGVATTPGNSVSPLVEPPATSSPAVTAKDTTTPEEATSSHVLKLPDNTSSGTTDNSSEPERELSPESRKLIKKIPSHLNQPDNKIPSFSVNHAKEPANVLDSGDIGKTGSNEAMGLKIQTKKASHDMDYELEQAYNALNGGNTEAAIDIYKTVLANEPNNTNALFALATIYHRAGQIEMARPLYAKLLSIDPTNRDGLNNFLVMLADEAPEEALAQLQKLEDRNPAFSPIPAQMAIIYEKLGNFDKANEKMVHAVELAPENLTYRYDLAIMLDKEKKYDEAAKLYRQIIDAWEHGDSVPGNIQKIQQRLTFISSNRP